MTGIFRRLGTAGLLVAALSMTGCATYEFTKPAPIQAGSAIAIKVTSEEMSGWSDLPIGAYKVPDSQVVISGHQKGTGVGMMFGLVGVAIAHAANASAGAEATKEAEEQLHLKLTPEVEATMTRLATAAAFHGRFVDKATAQSTLTVTPAVVMTFVSDRDVRPFVVLKATMPGVGGKPWTSRYIASSGEPRPLAGPGSWTENKGAALHSNVTTNIERAVSVMLSDAMSPYKRDDSHLSLVQGHFPYMKPKLQAVGYQLDEGERHVVFVPKLGDVLVFAGINVFEKEQVIYRVATKDDAPFKVVEPLAPSAAVAASKK